MSALAGRPAIVTGGGRGLGRGIAFALAAEGAPVALLGRTEATLQHTCDEIAQRGGKAIPVVCDVRELDDIHRAVDTVVDKLGGIRILVNNAQIIPHGMLIDIDEATIDDGWRSGPLAALRLMRACHPHLCDGGTVVNVSSGSAVIAGPPGHAIYAAVKAALQSINRSAAVEFAGDGIRVNAILPLAMSDAFAEWQTNDPESFRQVLTNIPLKRMGDPEREIGRVVVFLVGQDASMITGTTLPVDGGGVYLR